MKARDNPFSTDRVLRVRYKLCGVTWPGLWSRLESLNLRAAIVGPRGSGKTTLLEDLEPILHGKGYRPQRLRLDEENQSVHPDTLLRLKERLTSLDVVLLDGAEQLGWRAWRAFAAAANRAGGLVVTSHRPGRLPTLVRCRTDPRLLDAIVAELLAGVGRVPALPIAELFQRHRGNLRDALRDLYDLFAGVDP